MWIEGDEQRHQELELCNERKAILDRELTITSARVSKWERWISLESRIRRERERILDAGFVANIRQLEEELAQRAQAGGLDAVKTLLDRDLESLTAIEADIVRTEARVRELRRLRRETARPRTLRDSDFAVPAVGKVSVSLVGADANRNLSVAIANRILRSDVMLVIGQTFAFHGRWVEYEFEIARFATRRLPVLGLVVPGQGMLPREIRDRCDQTVEWDRAAIVDAIRTSVT